MQDLRGKNALVTGGSRGIGPYIGRALACEGANVALVARSPDKLAAMVQELTTLGIHATFIAADITDKAALPTLLKQVEMTLGPIDILVNNAAIEQLGHFARQSPTTIHAIVETNLTAPLILTRLVLPGMLARRCGHIANVASLTGKKAPPYNAVYGATKAALIEWTGALRGELEGSGVSASVICPGFIADVGMFVDHYGGRRPPRLMGESSPERVAQAVVRAIRQDRQEVLITGRPTRPLLALLALWPELGNAFLKRIGVVNLFRQLADKAETD